MQLLTKRERKGHLLKVRTSECARSIGTSNYIKHDENNIATAKR